MKFDLEIDGLDGLDDLMNDAGGLEAFDAALDCFDLSIGVESVGTRYIKPPLSPQIADRHLKYKNAEMLADAISPQKGEYAFVIVDGLFIFGDLIEAFIVKHNLHVKKLTIATLSMSENNVDSLANLMNGNYVDDLELMVSGYFFSHERGSLIPYIYQELDKNESFQLAACDMHMKTACFETHDGLKFVIHGSANLRSSGNVEQFVFEENETLYEFLQKTNAQIIETYKTINKGERRTKILRRKTMWQAVTNT